LIQSAELCDIPGDQDIVDALDLSDIDPERDGWRMLKMKRASGNYFVGSFGQLTSVRRDHIETKIIGRLAR
jgi:hypothetical protein